MAKRKIIFEEDIHYHIYNRGVDKRKIFMHKGDLYYFFDAMIVSNQKDVLTSTKRSQEKKKIKDNLLKEENLVSIISYCLLPNHFHLILKQETEGGISKFMSKLCGSYSRYFNEKYNRTGSLFQGRFKASILAFENSLEKTSAYVNTNYKHHKYNPKVDLIKTSLFEFLGTEKGEKICNQKEIDFIIKESGGVEKYKKNLKEYEKEFLRLKEEEKLE
jgi:REP element-mobilizing transposase RayT